MEFAEKQNAEGSEPRYMKRKVKAGNIEADYQQRALIVPYEVEATVVQGVEATLIREPSFRFMSMQFLWRILTATVRILGGSDTKNGSFVVSF